MDEPTNKAMPMEQGEDDNIAVLTSTVKTVDVVTCEDIEIKKEDTVSDMSEKKLSEIELAEMKAGNEASEARDPEMETKKLSSDTVNASDESETYENNQKCSVVTTDADDVINSLKNRETLGNICTLETKTKEEHNDTEEESTERKEDIKEHDAKLVEYESEDNSDQTESQQKPQEDSRDDVSKMGDVGVNTEVKESEKKTLESPEILKSAVTLKSPETLKSPIMTSDEEEEDLVAAVEKVETNWKQQENGKSAGSLSSCFSQAELQRFRNHFFETVEELRIRRAMDTENEDKICQLVNEKHILETNFEEAVSSVEKLKEEKEDKVSQAKKQYEAQIKQLRIDKAKYSVHCEASEREIKSLKNEILTLQLNRYSLEKKQREVERKLQLQSSAKESNLSQLGEVEHMTRTLEKRAAELTEQHTRLTDNVATAREFNRKLACVNEHQKCVMSGHKRELVRLQQELLEVKVKLDKQPGDIDQRLMEKEQRILRLQQEAKANQETIKFLRKQFSESQIDKKAGVESLQAAHELIERHVECANRHREEAETLERELTELRETHGKLKQSYDETVKQLEIEKEIHSKAVEEWRKQEECVTLRLSSLKGDHERLIQTHAELEELNTRWAKKNVDLREQLNTAQSELNKPRVDIEVQTECCGIDAESQTEIDQSESFTQTDITQLCDNEMQTEAGRFRSDQDTQTIAEPLLKTTDQSVQTDTDKTSDNTADDASQSTTNNLSPKNLSETNNLSAKSLNAKSRPCGPSRAPKKQAGVSPEIDTEITMATNITMATSVTIATVSHDKVDESSPPLLMSTIPATPISQVEGSTLNGSSTAIPALSLSSTPTPTSESSSQPVISLTPTPESPEYIPSSQPLLTENKKNTDPGGGGDNDDLELSPYSRFTSTLKTLALTAKTDQQQHADTKTKPIQFAGLDDSNSLHDSTKDGGESEPEVKKMRLEKENQPPIITTTVTTPTRYAFQFLNFPEKEAKESTTAELDLQEKDKIPVGILQDPSSRKLRKSKRVRFAEKLASSSSQGDVAGSTSCSTPEEMERQWSRVNEAFQDNSSNLPNFTVDDMKLDGEASLFSEDEDDAFELNSQVGRIETFLKTDRLRTKKKK